MVGVRSEFMSLGRVVPRGMSFIRYEEGTGARDWEGGTVGYGRIL